MSNMSNMSVKSIEIAEAGRKFTPSELGIEVNRQELVDTIANAPKGSFIFVKRYESKGGHGEVADFFYLKGVSYGAMKQRSLDKLAIIEKDADFSMLVTWQEWVNPETGKKTTGNAKNKELRTHKTTFHHGDHRLQQAIDSIRESILNPRQRPSIYEKDGNGIYTQTTDDGFCLHIRDCQKIHKNVVMKGNYPIKTTSEPVALKTTLKSMLPIGHYRQVRLDGRYDYITVAGQIIMQTEDGKRAMIGLKEHTGLVRSRMDSIDEEVEMEKVYKEELPALKELADCL